MLDDAVLLGASIVAYIYLRSHGGKGLNIKAKMAPASTPQGRRDRILGIGVLLLLLLAVIFDVTHQNGQNPLIVVMPVLAGALLTLISYWAKHKK